MADVINSGVPTPIQIYGRAPNGQLQAVTTDGAGNISFAGAGGTPGGSTTQVQFNNTGAFAGDPNFVVLNSGGTATNVKVGSGTDVGTNNGLIFSIQSGNAGGAGVTTLNANSPFRLLNPGGATIFAVDNAAGIAGGNLQLYAAAQNGVANTSGVIGYDTTTSTLSFNNTNGVGNTAPSGIWNNTNVTPVTVNANVATAQNLMSASIPAGTINRLGKSIRIWAAGVYTLPASAGTTTTIAVTLGGVTLLTITDTSLTTGVTNGQFLLTAMASVQTAGSSGVLEVHGQLGIELGATGAVADSYFLDTNTAVSSAINLTTAQTLQVTVTFSVASASNTATQRQMVLETIG